MAVLVGHSTPRAPISRMISIGVGECDSVSAISAGTMENPSSRQSLMLLELRVDQVSAGKK
jgi:hypothetical protein